MDVFRNYLASYTFLLFLFIFCVIQESSVDAVRGGNRYRRSFRRSSYYMYYYDSYKSTSHSHTSSASVAGAVIGCIGAAIFITGVVILICVCCRKSRTRQGQVIQRNDPLPPPYTAAPVYCVTYDNKGMQMDEKQLECIPTPPPYNEINQTQASPPEYEPPKY